MVVLYSAEPPFFMNRQLTKTTKCVFNWVHPSLYLVYSSNQGGYQTQSPSNYSLVLLIDLFGRIYFALCLLSICLFASPAWSTPQPHTPNAADLNLTPEDLKNSPVLRRWLHKVPNILDEINNDPGFRTRLRLGYSLFPSKDAAGGWIIGVEDLLIDRSRFTVSGGYQATFNGERQAYGADLHYYVRPLGKYVNLAPLVGYRHLSTDEYSMDGINLGARLLLVLSRGGAADISFTQSWVSPGTDEEVGLTTLSFGYAVTRNLRLSTDIQKQNSRHDKDNRVGIVLEWMP